VCDDMVIVYLIRVLGFIPILRLMIRYDDFSGLLALGFLQAT